MLSKARYGCDRVWRSRVEAVVFVLIWIALGVLLPTGPAGYLLLGVPLAVGFQLVVRRRPRGAPLISRVAGSIKLAPNRATSGLGRRNRLPGNVSRGWMAG